MAKAFKARVQLRHSEKVYRLLSVELNPGSDGSLHVIMVRDGVTESSVTVKVEDQSVSVSPPRTSRRGFRLTYHPTGQVNFHYIVGASIFMEPIFHIRRCEALIDFSVPDVDRLDIARQTGDEDTVIEVPRGRLDFALAIAPWDAPQPQSNSILWAWTWQPLFSLWLLQAPPPPQQLLNAQPNHFLYVPRQSGLFPSLCIGMGEAMVSFHQALHEVRSDILYYPDGEGVCRIVYVVPMRIAPSVEVRFRDPTLSAEIIKLTTTEQRYRVRDGKGRLVRDARAVDVAHLIRDAEL